MRLVLVLLWVIFLTALFRAGYQLTGWYFHEKLVPYPFEMTGMAVGTGCALLGLALGFTLWNLFRKK